MKKIFTTFVAILAISQISNAQWAPGTPSGSYVLNSGYVGIGTTNPLKPLDLRGEMRLLSGGTGNGSRVSSDALGFFISNDDASTDAFRLYGGIGNLQLFTINSSGNVGIGTQTPGSDLTIRRNGSGISLNTGSTGYFGTIAFNRESQTGAIFNSAGNAFQINNGGFDANLHFQVYNGLGAAVNPDALTINGSNGGVGINTAIVPANYHFAVNGAAIVTSMTVKLYSAWPDYVFKKGYHLPTLSEVSNYIAKNNRLPDMPSENQVAKDGINLGEMVTLQTKKIEELTLYLIEKDKQVEQQSQQLKDQQKQLDELKAQMAKLIK